MAVLRRTSLILSIPDAQPLFSWLLPREKQKCP